MTAPATDQAQEPPFEYPRDPGRRCDVVMKGGITSGVVYPRALCRLAGKFLLQNIGGTSAGAIAAAGAAASEYGRRNESGTGYLSIQTLPNWLSDKPEGSDDSNLFNLFQPSQDTRGLFALLVAAISHPKQTVAFEILASTIANWKLRALIGALPGIGLFALLFLALADHSGVTAVLALFAGMLGALALALVGTLGVLGYTLYSEVPKVLTPNYFGVCRGIRPPGAPEGGPEALTEWLDRLIREASGVPLLTFGDLWGGADGPRDIDLQMITTCLTLGRPYRLPFALTDDLYFKPGELRDLFPNDVVAHLESAAGEHAVGDLLPLPGPEDLPVVFAARLSLSFPFLLSTVPLYLVPVTPDGERGEPLRCLFSDGGICSNFPINFFDSPLPRWPTFGINLAGKIVDDVEVWMPTSNVDPTPGPRVDVNSIAAFGNAIFRSAQNWRDNSYVDMPGFRDRIAHIRFREGEGGLNLNMPKDLIDDLTARGDLAGQKLASRFADGVDVPGAQHTDLDWNNHRRIRQRVAFEAIEGFAMSLLVGYTGDPNVTGAPRGFGPNTPMTGEQTYEALLQAPNVPPVYGGFDDSQQSLALLLAAIANPLATAWAAIRGRDLPPRVTPSMSVGAPLPVMEIRIAPPL